MNQEHLLPRFDAPPQKEPAVDAKENVEEPEPPDTPQAATPSVADGSAASPVASVAATEAATSEPVPVPAAAKAETAKKEKAGFFSRVARLCGFGRRAKTVRPGTKRGRMVQTELSLDSLKVVRNDLQDSDFEVVPVRGAPQAASGNGSGQQVGVVWNRLSAKLLRQAVQDFNFVQKERGKLLSQTGSDRGSPRGA
jgi:hypothetical protein